MSPAILVVDQGTTNSKALLVDEFGSVLSIGVDRVGLQYPRPGWVECDANELWQSALRAIEACLIGTDARQIAAVAITNQRESVLLWDRRTGEPLGPCISWQCRRTAPLCDDLRAQGEEPWVRQRTGLAIDPLFSASKARWLLDRIEDAPARIARSGICFGTVDTWLVWNMTGGDTFMTDVTNAARTQLLDLASGTWDSELAALFGVPVAVLPEVRGSSGVVGRTRSIGAIPPGLPIAGVVGDSHAALFGHGAPSVGTIKATFGTGTSVMTPIDADVRVDGLSTTVAWGIQNPDPPGGVDISYALEGNITATGATLEWLAGVLALPGRERELEALAASVEDSGGVTIVPAFAGLGAPHWDADARGLIAGLTRGSTAAHIARAAFESIAFQVRDVVEVLRATFTARPAVLLADGGVSHSDLLIQLQADVLQLPVERSGSGHASAIGAALLAGLAIGWWESLDEIRALPRATQRVEPRSAAAVAGAGYASWRDAVDRARGSFPGRVSPHAPAEV